MKRRIALLPALLFALLALVTAPLATAQPRWRGGGGFGGRHEQGDYGGRAPAYGRAWAPPARMAPQRPAPAARFARPPGPAYDRPQAYAPRGYGAPWPGGGGSVGGGYGFQPRFAPPPMAGRWRRGEFLPPSYRGYVLQDYGRYHLRRPPRGYYWCRSGDDFVLVAAATGLIFDVINGDD